MTAGAHSPQDAVSDARPGAYLTAIYLGAIFLSASLIFVVQPMFTRFVLPRLGGSPGVWSVAIVFFQAVLFAGYLYAHILTRLVDAKRGVLIHLALTAVALVWLPLGIARGWGDPPATGEALWLIGLFASSIGMPYFILSANGPLLQAWFLQAAAGTRSNPYFLYAVSNAGSFLALLAYPFMIEPLMTLQGQSRLWTIGFTILLLLIAACGALVWANPNAGRPAPMRLAETAPGWSDLAKWTALAAVPTALLVAVTAQISTDIAAIPLVWIIPLALYLLTLVVVFRSWPDRAHAFVARATPLGLIVLAFLMVIVPETNIEGWRFFAELLVHIGVFVLVAFLCHGELARRKPEPSQLTIFYLAMSFGGMLGGAFASLLAPSLFNWVAEYPLLLVAAALCIPAGTSPGWLTDTRVRIGLAALAVLVVLPWLSGMAGSLEDAGRIGLGALCLGAAALALRHRLALAVALGLAFTSARLYPPEGETAVSFRSFFGVHKIHESEDGEHRLLMHGTTIHGAQRIRDGNGKPVTGTPEPLTYYHRESPIAEAISAARARKRGPIAIAAVGLGAGSMACLVDSADQLTYFEIDPIVDRIARDPRYFSFISACRPKVETVMGDARLTLARAKPASYDVIVVDAFASDAIPTHLLTQEAMKLYVDKLTPNGMIILHLSSRHMELVSVAHAVARAAGLVSRNTEDDLPEEAFDEYKFDTTVVVVTRKAEDLGVLASKPQWQEVDPDLAYVRPWTDDYSNPLGALWRHLD